VTGLRNLFLILALLNLGALALFSWVIDQPVASPAYDGPGITLLRELDPNTPIVGSELTSTAVESVTPDIAAPLPDDDTPAEQTAAEPLTPEPIVVTGSAGGRCLSIGPFQDPADAALAMATLVEAGYRPNQTTRENEIWDGYWVYIEQIEDLDEARAIQADLADEGIEDTQIVRTSDGGNLLSLGVFSAITRAGALAERVNRVGYEATIADNMTTTETHWLDIMLTSEQSLALDMLLDMLQEPGRISRLETLACTSDQTD
jgi:hypothetical protein